jgi:hypothetical protein
MLPQNHYWTGLDEDGAARKISWIFLLVSRTKNLWVKKDGREVWIIIGWGGKK